MRRRHFLKSAAALAAVAAPAVVRGQNLNSKIQVAGIGTEGQGWSDISQVAQHPAAEFVAFADVDLARTERVKQLRPGAPVFQDFRQMLAERGDEIDACTISTPDHMHAFIGLTAMLAGKHVYVQKPLTHTVDEARKMRLVARQAGVITRLGNQIHSHTHYRTAVRLIRGGTIGKVKEVHSWVGVTGHGYSGHLDRPKATVAPPASFDWDLWLGVAHARPPAAQRVYAPFCWRDWQEFGSGAIGDFGCHLFDPVFTALDIAGAPLTVHNENTGMNDEVWPAQQTIRYVFPGTEFTAREAINITWYDGGRLPAVAHEKVSSGRPLPASGSLFVGETGTLVLPHVGAPQLHGNDAFAEHTVEPAEDGNHYHGWVDGIVRGEQPSDGFDYAGPLTEAVQLGNVAARFSGQKLEWDAAAMQVTNLPDANAYLARDYRAGWALPEIG